MVEIWQGDYRSGVICMGNCCRINMKRRVEDNK